MEQLPEHFAGGICIKDGNILLIYRINKERSFHQEYFVLPGAIVHEDESIEEAVKREFNDVSMTVRVGDLFYESAGDESDDKEFYYLCDYITGSPELSMYSNEAEIMKQGEQFYTPMWVPLSELEELIVYPESVKNKILFDLESQ